MNNRIFFVENSSRAMTWVKKELMARGLQVEDTPSPLVTHLLLGVPCGVSEERLVNVLQQLPTEVRVLGGNLDRPALEGYTCRDLLKDELYLAENARVTAYCALQVAAEKLPVTLENCSVLILGWGRIGKCLAQLLKALGADVTIAARKERDQAAGHALGYRAETLPFPDYMLCRYRVIFNTVPVPMLSAQQLSHCRKDCLKIELASRDGLEGDDIIIARRLPGTCVPETSGKLIARTVLRICARKEV